MAVASKKNRGPGAVDLIEEAVHLLRGNPRLLGMYYALSAPFALGLVYFWGSLTWFAPSDGEVAMGALALAALFAVMKAGHRRFALGLLAVRSGEAAATKPAKGWIAFLFAELRVHVTAPIVLPLAFVFGVPFGWAYAFYQGASALPAELEGAERRAEAWRQASLWPAQNHIMLAIVGTLWLVVFLNLVFAFYSIPNAATEWLGLNTVFAMSGWDVLNTTFLILVAMLTHLAVDPLAKTCYVLRVFHGRARHTGADIKLVLARERATSRLGHVSSAALLAMVALFLVPPSFGNQPAPSTPVVPPQQLDRAISEALEQPDFRWRLRPVPRSDEAADDGIVREFLRATVNTISEMVRATKRLFRSAQDWFNDFFPSEQPTEGDDRSNTSSLDWMAVLQMAAIVVLACVVGLFLFVAWRMWRQNRRSAPLTSGAMLAMPAAPDLEDETVEASQLPSDGWLALARGKMADGEWRLALRALFLATLAAHAREGLVSLAKSKTNLDYETELRRRAREKANLVQEFRLRRRLFEEVWYGSHPVRDDDVRSWLARLEARR